MVRPGISRRDFLSKVGLGAAAGGLLAACGASSSASGGTSGPKGTGTPLPRPNHPVKWPVFSGNEPIKSGLAPEKGATLQIYNWVAYINEAVVKNFCKKYQCKYQITTFNTMEEAIAKLASGQLKFDIFFPTIDVIGPLVEEKLMRPLNHSYIPNIASAWSDYENPFYDQGWQYSVPYTIYTTGMAWRKDHVPENPYTMANPWAMPWQAKYKGKVAILDDYREGLSLALMKNGIFDLNTTSSSQIAAAGQQLHDLQSLVDVQDRQQRLHRRPCRQDMDTRSLVRRYRLRAGIPAEGNTRSTSSATGSRPTGGAGQQRHYNGPFERREPGAGAPFPELPARLRQRHRELQLHRIHAAAHGHHPATTRCREAPAALAHVDSRAAVLFPARGPGARAPRLRRTSSGSRLGTHSPRACRYRGRPR